jgi:hypothetical protein
MKRFLPLLLMTLIWAAAPAQRASWQARLDTQRIRIGEQVSLILEAQLPPERRAVWPTVADSGDGWLLVKRGAFDTLEAPKSLTILRQKLRLTSFDSGLVYLPAWPLIVGRDTLRTDSLPLQVQLPDLSTRQGLFGLKDLLEVPRPWWFWALWIGGPLLLIALVILLVLYGRRRLRQPTTYAVPSLPPYEEAVQALDALEREELWQQGQVKTYYSRLIDILRRYWERRYGMRAMEKTAAELSDAIPRLGLPREMAQELAEVLQQSALVKYARQEPTSGANERAAQLIREVIEKTRPTPPENEEQGA